MVSPAVAVALFTLSSELGRVTQSRDSMEEAGVEGAGAGLDTLEVLRLALVRHAKEEIERVYRTKLDPSILCEAGVIHTILDVTFLRYWLSEVDEGFPHSTELDASSSPATLEATLESLVQYMDPINWQTYESLIEDAVRAQSSGCHFILSYLLRRPQATGPLSRSLSISISSSTSAATGLPSPTKKKTVTHLPDEANIASSNVMALIPSVPRFPLLPLPIDAATPTTPLVTRLASPAKEPVKPNLQHLPFGGAVAGAASAVLPSFAFSFITNQATSRASSLLRATKRS